MFTNTFITNGLTLFSQNPYRILGISCSASKSEITAAYEEIYKLVNLDTLDTLKNDFELVQLEKPDYSAGMLNIAYADISEIKHKVFAFNDKLYTMVFSINEITDMLEKINCYDEFLSCYLWLLLNDSDFKYKDLWSKLCNYIDMLIELPAMKWQEYFDNRFSIDDINENYECYKEFYEEFRGSILTPIKEIVKGSNNCDSAREVLFTAISNSRVSAVNYDEELMKLANQVDQHASNSEIEDSYRKSIYLLDNEEEVAEESVSLVDLDYDDEDSVYRDIVQNGELSKNYNMDAIDIEKSADALGRNTAKVDYGNMDSLDSNIVTEKLVSPKMNNAKEMTGIIADHNGVREVNEVPVMATNNSFNSGSMKDQNAIMFERLQQEQKKNKQKSNIGFFIKLLIFLGAIGGVVLYFIKK